MHLDKAYVILVDIFHYENSVLRTENLALKEYYLLDRRLGHRLDKRLYNKEVRRDTHGNCRKHGKHCLELPLRVALMLGLCGDLRHCRLVKDARLNTVFVFILLAHACLLLTRTIMQMTIAISGITVTSATVQPVASDAVISSAPLSKGLRSRSTGTLSLPICFIAA